MLQQQMAQVHISILFRRCCKVVFAPLYVVQELIAVHLLSAETLHPSVCHVRAASFANVFRVLAVSYVRKAYGQEVRSLREVALPICLENSGYRRIQLDSS